MPPPVASAATAPPAAPPARRAPFADEAAPGQPWVTTVERSQLRTMRKQLGWMLLACMAVALLFVPQPWRTPKAYGVSLLYSFSYCAGLWLANGYTVDWLNLKVGWEERPLRRLLLTVGASALASMLVILAVPELYSMLLWHRPPGYSLTHGALRQGLFPLLVTVVVSLFLHSRSFLLAWREATVRAERLEKESAVARLDSLRRQVDPHFLFNALNALTSLVEGQEAGRAVRFIRQLSQVYRYVLESQEQELVPLAQELAFAEAYVFLQQTRLEGALQVVMPLAADEPLATPTGESQPGSQQPEPQEGASQTNNLYLPPLALQLLLENALKHNAAYQSQPLHLRVTLDVAAATLTVRNTLRPRRLAPGEVSGRGLANLRARYAFLTPRPVEAGPVGEEFVVALPLLTL